jgi:hypothetical protein
MDAVLAGCTGRARADGVAVRVVAILIIQVILQVIQAVFVHDVFIRVAWTPSGRQITAKSKA